MITRVLVWDYWLFIIINKTIENMNIDDYTMMKGLIP